jgi:hypothetical protein
MFHFHCRPQKRHTAGSLETTSTIRVSGRAAASAVETSCSENRAPQYRQTRASALIVSAQSGHLRVSSDSSDAAVRKAVGFA